MRIASTIAVGLAGLLVGALGASLLKERRERVIHPISMLCTYDVLKLADEEARRLNHHFIGTEHLLLGLLRDNESIAAQALHSAGVESQQVRAKIEAIIGRGKHLSVGEIALTRRVKKVMELAFDEAHWLGQHCVGSEHLLLGLIREGEGIAAGVLESLGVDLQKLRMQTLKLLVARSL